MIRGDRQLSEKTMLNQSDRAKVTMSLQPANDAHLRPIVSSSWRLPDVVCYLSNRTASFRRRFSFRFMPLLPRKGALAIAAVIDVALQAQGHPVSAKILAARLRLPPRHLEPVLQALVRDGILKGIRGPHGGYELARDRRRVTANDILRAAGTAEDSDDPHSGSELLNKIVLPTLSNAELEFGIALSRINLDDMTRSAESLKIPAGGPARRP